jgi:putative ABC transport system substrate-binding protein
MSMPDEPTDGRLITAIRALDASRVRACRQGGQVVAADRSADSRANRLRSNRCTCGSMQGWHRRSRGPCPSTWRFHQAGCRAGANRDDRNNPRAATDSIPIVFMHVPDPVGSKLVEGIRRPGWNATGLTNFSVDLSAKRLEYLEEIVPSLSRVALLINSSAKISELYIEESKAAGPKLGLTTQVFEVRAAGQLEAAFDAMVKADMHGVVVNAESLFYQVKDATAKLALDRRMPTCVWVKEVLEAGTLVSYGADQRAIARRVAVYADRILKGEKPADMPVEQPARFQLLLNLKTAKALGLTVPQILLAQADEVIE